VKDLFSLEGEVIVVTGGSGFFGSAMAEGFLEFGASVMLADIRTTEESESKLNGKSYPGRLSSAYCDVSDTASIREMFRTTKERFGKVTVLVNNAYIGAAYGGKMEHMSDEDWQKGFDGAGGTAFRCTREAVPYLEEKGGAVINIASMYGIVSPDPRIYGDSGANNPANYGAGKAAVLQLTRYCAGHLAAKGIRVNSITPGPFPHPAIVENQPEFVRKLEDKTMLGRVGQRHEIVGAAVLLASRASGFMTGANIVIDGGWTAW